MSGVTEITAKVKCSDIHGSWQGAKNIAFMPDYGEGRNASWAAATPNLQLTLTVREDVAQLFTVGASYTLTFTPEAEEPAPAAAAPDVQLAQGGTVDSVQAA